jgi:chemotaxis protein CheC
VNTTDSTQSEPWPTDSVPSDPLVRIVERFFSAATAHAAEAMSVWTEGRIRMSLDRLREIPLENVAEELGLSDELSTMIVLGIDGEVGGQFLLSLDNDNGRRLAALLMNSEQPSAEEWSELEISAAMETGNILASAYLNELSRLIGTPLIPTPPNFVQDFGASIVQQAVMMQAMARNLVLLGQVRFQLDHDTLQWNVLVVPSPELLDMIENSVSHS